MTNPTHTVNPIGNHPALTFPWNRRGLSRKRILEFLELCRRLGHDVDPLVPLLDVRRDQLTAGQLLGRP